VSSSVVDVDPTGAWVVVVTLTWALNVVGELTTRCGRGTVAGATVGGNATSGDGCARTFPFPTLTP
jgi:hypothetical protein